MLRVTGPLVMLVAMLLAGGWEPHFGTQADGASAASAPTCSTAGLRASGTTGDAPVSTLSLSGTSLDRADVVVVEAVDLAFDPCEITIPANTPITLTLRNEGAAIHRFVIDALGIDERTLPGETTTVVVSAPAGVYEFYSDVPGHRQAGMVGRLTVVTGEPVAIATGSLAAGTPYPATGMPSLGAFRVTLAPGASVASRRGTSRGQRSVYVQTGGPATFALDGPATVLRPAGNPSTLPANGGVVELGPLAGIVIPPTTGYELRNDGQEPLVMLWVTVGTPEAAASGEPVFEAPGVLILQLVPIELSEAPVATPAP